MAPEADCHLPQQDVGVVFVAAVRVGVHALSSWGQAALSLQAVTPFPQCWFT